MSEKSQRGSQGHRGHGEGHIRKRIEPNGTVRWEAQLTLPDGTRRSLYAKTRGEVQRKLLAAKVDIEQGVPLADGRQTVAQYLASWLETVRPPRLAPDTWRRYDECVRLHLVPALGRVRLAALTPAMVQKLYADLAAGGLSSTTVKHNHAVLHRALAMAVRLGVVARNVTDLVEKPKKRHVEIRPLSREQARAYLDAAESERLEALFVLALASGMRLGELLALRWSVVDLEARPAPTVRVVATLKKRKGTPATLEQTKTVSSRRQIRLAAYVVETLRTHRTRQLVERMAAGPIWGDGREGEDQDLVFCTEFGAALPLNQVYVAHRRILKAAHLPAIRPHDLRHTCATLLLAARVNPKVVSEQLGHASVAFTLQTYAHVLPDMQEDAVAAMTAAMGW